MSCNTCRILNNLEYEINENKQDISMLEQKTLYISDQLSVDGTVFEFPKNYIDEVREALKVAETKRTS